MDYRKRIYKQYASAFQDADQSFNNEEAIRWGRAYDYYFRKWLPKDKGASIIDLACGGGKLLYFFKKHNYNNITGVDISPEQVMVSSQVCPHVYEANLLDFLASHPSTYDLITGIDIIEHFTKDETLLFLDRCFTALKPGGRIILQTPNADSPWGTAYRYGDLTHEICFSPNALMRIMRLCDFTLIESRELGPVPFGHSIKSSLRYVLWQGIRYGFKAWNVIETGCAGSGIFTRVFLVTSRKP
jgi:2-polyprenyl-3-methyl-5-hydroxy-6-metoxy-1,4-benzoquinol methylase